MKHAKRHPLIFGTIILTATGLITRVIGFLPYLSVQALR